MGLAKSRAASADELASKREMPCLVDLNPLPDELLVLVLSWVSSRSLVTRCRLVCQRWKDLIDSPTLWKLKWKREPSKRGLLEAALKVARRTPQIEWSRLGVLEPFGRNLIKNPCGTERLLHWEIQQGGDGWTVEENLDFVEGAEAQTCFVSSYMHCAKWQVVDLLKEGLWEDLLDICQPDIVISDWWGPREDCGCQYAISVSLLAANRNLVLAEFSLRPNHIPQWNDAKYQQVSHVFQNYGPGVRYIRFLHTGQDTQYWAGHYGARITNSTVLVKIS
ncbi:hypothetical protein lerEdw1_015449 [Lerista edwardsae]|nr:hypothetical protein lerEdw1_015449 [Lerista edwardsae]